MAMRQAKTILVTSVKGGTGKTTMAINLAGIYQNLNLNVLLIDLDIYGGSVAASLNLDYQNDLFDAMDDLNNNRFTNLENYVTPYMKKLDILPAPKDPRLAGKMSSKYLRVILTKAKLKYDVVVIDTNYFLSDMNLLAMDASDEILYMVTNDPMDLKNMRTMVSIYSDMDKNNYKVILNESIYKMRNYFTAYDMRHMMNHVINYTIPQSFYIRNIEKYIMDGKITILDKKVRATHKKGVQNIEKLAESLIKYKKIKTI